MNFYSVDFNNSKKDKLKSPNDNLNKFMKELRTNHQCLEHCPECNGRCDKLKGHKNMHKCINNKCSQHAWIKET